MKIQIKLGLDHRCMFLRSAMLEGQAQVCWMELVFKVFRLGLLNRILSR